jgi:hypothetical protein
VEQDKKATTTFVEQDKKATFADSFCQVTPQSRDVGVQIRILSGFPVGCQTGDVALRNPSNRSERGCPAFESPETGSHATAGKPTAADRGEATAGRLFLKLPKLEIFGSILHKSDLYE